MRFGAFYGAFCRLVVLYGRWLAVAGRTKSHKIGKGREEDRAMPKRFIVILHFESKNAIIATLAESIRELSITYLSLIHI